MRMQRISRAPELSATLSFVSCWITVAHHLARSSTSSSRQRFVRESGRVSTMRTTSPSWA
jgi:hypothetical protein